MPTVITGSADQPAISHFMRGFRSERTDLADVGRHRSLSGAGLMKHDSLRIHRRTRPAMAYCHMVAIISTNETLDALDTLERELDALEAELALLESLMNQE